MLHHGHHHECCKRLWYGHLRSHHPDRSNIFISLLRKIIPDEVRIACYIVVIAGFVTIVDLCLQAFVPDIAESLGVFIPLIVVNCIILGRAEAFASKNSVAASAVDGICQGIGYTWCC